MKRNKYLNMRSIDVVKKDMTLSLLDLSRGINYTTFLSH